MTAKIKLNAASGGGSISIQAPSSSSNNRVISLPDIADGTLVTSESTLDATKLSGNLPAISGAALTGIAAGITEADQWRVTSEFTFGTLAARITSNWERVDNPSIFEKIGTGMSVDGSGNWSFPSTGKWLIMCSWIGRRASGTTEHGQLHMYTTINNGSNWEEGAVSNVSCGRDGARNTASFMFLFDCQDISNYKLHFGYYDANGTTIFVANSLANRNSFTFIKLGET